MLEKLNHLSTSHKLIIGFVTLFFIDLVIAYEEIIAYANGEGNSHGLLTLLLIAAVGAVLYTIIRKQDAQLQDGAGQLAAIHRAQAVIEFDLDGNILTANRNFLDATGYQLEEIIGKHHGIFVDSEYRNSQAYRNFWEDLRQGKFKADKYVRYNKNGDEIWIQATYNPISDANGNPFKVVKYAVDVTHQREEALRSIRVQTALDCVTSNVMVADENYDIIFMNPALEKMLGDNEAKIQEELSNFKMDEIIGGNIDRFHKEPSHQRRMLDGLTSTYETTISIAGLSFNLVASPIMDAAGKKLGIVVEWQDVTQQRVDEARASRIQTSLDCVTSNVMLADENNDIIYANPAVVDMLRVAENDLRKDLPKFDSDTVVGSNIDIFHKNPEHQKGMLESLKTTYETSIKVGGRTFDLIASPVFGTDESRLGTVVEWKDVTQEKAIEEEIQEVVSACAAGNFTKRLTTEDKEGFFEALAEGINEISEISHQGLSETVEVLGSLSDGNLTKAMEGEYQGTFNDIKTGLNTTIVQLHDMAEKIQESASSVNSASNEISSGSGDLSQRTEHQASTLEETAASMEEITATVRQNSSNADQANKLAVDASSVASRGGEVVERAVEAMGRIEESAKKISDIIGVIDEIAFQTNLLALNAAVEAARAGDAGKGFAVVASEVRTLAGRSAEASKDIKKLIQESSNEVTAGSELVNEAGQTLSEIVTSVKEVAGLISEIADASAEQTTGIEEINTAVSQMDENTQQNAALVQENTAAAASLVEQSEELEQLVSFFTLEEEEASMLQLASHLPEKTAGAEEKIVDITPPAKPKKKVAGATNYNEGWEEF